MMANSIPIIDLQKICQSSPSLNDWENVAGEVRKALNRVGFMYLINHGVPSDVIAENFKISADFFSLPKDTKQKYKKNLKESRNGWVEPGEELLHPDSKYEYRECFDIIRQKPLYPTDIIPCFRESHKKLESCCQKLIKSLLKLLAISLKLDDSDYFIKCCLHLDNSETANESDFSMIHYPPIHSDTILPPDTVRCAEHTDYEIMTLLFQNQVGGLEIKTADGNWISADPIPNAILVNTGDLLEMWTNKFYLATLHRVVIPKTPEERALSRYSFAYFIAPDNSTLIKPLKSDLIPKNVVNEDPSTVERFEEREPVVITALEHIIQRVNVAYGVKSN